MWPAHQCTLRLAVAVALLALSACARQAPQTRVLFDEGHAQQFHAGTDGPLDLSGLAALFLDQRASVGIGHDPITDNALSNVDVLIISGPFAPIVPAETESIARFLDRGGRVCVMLHIAPPAADLLHQLNVSVSNGVIREREDILGDDPMNFRVTRLAPDDLTKHLPGFDVYGAWALLSTADGATVVARTSPMAWIDLNGDHTLGPGDAVQSFAVVVAGARGKGHFVVFGDDAIFQNRFLVGDNRRLAENLVGWLR